MVSNPNLRRFLQMYSQSRLSNVETRGYDELTYVATKLDEVLIPMIKEGKHALYIITGNAGDGKTAFIQHLEQEIKKELEKRGEKFQQVTKSGSRFHYKARTHTTLYDGSQDFEATSSNEILREFFHEFEGEQVAAAVSLVKVIAVNAGRLVHYLTQEESRYAWLAQEVSKQLAGEPPTGPVLVINLNARSLVDGEILNYTPGNTKSVFDRLLDKLLDTHFWQPCLTCEVKEKCYVRFNVDTLLDPSSGPIVRQRLKFLFQVFHFRRKLHVTIRELRSALAYILFGIKDCHQIQEDMAREKSNLRHLYYNAAFEGAERDRLISLLAQLDVAQISNPHLDNHIASTPPEMQRGYLTFQARSALDMPLLQQLYDNRPEDIFSRDPEKMKNAQLYHDSSRRKYFFENALFREQEEQTGRSSLPEVYMLPSRSAVNFAFAVAAKAPSEEVLSNIFTGLNRGEGISLEDYESRYLCVRTSKRGSEVRAFAVYPVADFAIQCNNMGYQENLVEFLPDCLILSYRPTGDTVEVGLDLYEAIERMRDGYMPSASELKAFFQNIVSFKKKVLGVAENTLVLYHPLGQRVVMERVPQGELMFR